VLARARDEASLRRTLTDNANLSESLRDASRPLTQSVYSLALSLVRRCHVPLRTQWTVSVSGSWPVVACLSFHYVFPFELLRSAIGFFLLDFGRAILRVT